MEFEFFIGDAIKVDADPASAANIRRFVEFLWRAFDEHRLHARRGGYHHRYVAVVVMVERAHRKDLLTKKGWLAVR